MAMGCPHQGRSGGLNATITSRPFDSPRPSPGGYTAGELIVDEVDRPACVRQGRQKQRRSASGGPLAPSAPSHRQPFFAIEPLGSLPVLNEAFPAQQDVQTPVAEARRSAASSRMRARKASSGGRRDR